MGHVVIYAEFGLIGSDVHAYLIVLWKKSKIGKIYKQIV